MRMLSQSQRQLGEWCIPLYSFQSCVFILLTRATCRDADFIFYTLMEYQKHCLASTPDAAKATQAFMATVAAKFTQEAFHTLRQYLSTTPDVKNEINLLLRAQKFTDAGMTMTKRALATKGDAREKHTVLSVR